MSLLLFSFPRGKCKEIFPLVLFGTVIVPSPYYPFRPITLITALETSLSNSIVEMTGNGAGIVAEHITLLPAMSASCTGAGSCLGCSTSNLALC